MYFFVPKEFDCEASSYRLHLEQADLTVNATGGGRARIGYPGRPDDLYMELEADGHSPVVAASIALMDAVRAGFNLAHLVDLRVMTTAEARRQETEKIIAESDARFRATREEWEMSEESTSHRMRQLSEAQGALQALTDYVAQRLEELDRHIQGGEGGNADPGDVLEHPADEVKPHPCNGGA